VNGHSSKAATGFDVMRTYHRVLALFILVFTLYLSTTGTLIQLTDLRTLYTHASADNPNMMAIREGINGTSDFQVIDNADYTASTLPDDLDATTALNRVMTAARAGVGTAPIQYVELRMVDGAPVGQIKSDARLLRFDVASGVLLSEGKPTQAAGGTFGRSLRNTFKGLHRMTAISDWTLWVNVLIGLSLCAMLVTGLVMYFRLLAARRRVGRAGLFWSAGGTWRSLHRAISLLSAAFLLVVALSGTWLSVESLGRAIMGVYERAALARGELVLDGNAPVHDSELSSMLETTLDAYRRSQVAAPIRVMRLRVYGGMQQGVIVTGEEEARQLVFNATSGRRAGTTEPGYPPQHFPFGWQAHQIAKQVHRGDIIGLPGRWMDLFSGLSLIFLSVSGAVMYVDLWQRRRRSGRASLLWK
jgi:uncharacterized iron-regulated membrane protein